MDDRSPQLELIAESSHAPRGVLADERRHAEQFLAEHRQQLEHGENELIEQLLVLVEDLTNRESEVDEQQARLDERVELLQTAADQLEQEKTEVEEQRAEVNRCRENESEQESEWRASLDDREAALAQREAKLTESEQQLGAQQEQVRADLEAVALSDHHLANDLDEARQAREVLETKITGSECEKEEFARQCEELSAKLKQRDVDLESRDEQLASQTEKQATLATDNQRLTDEATGLEQQRESLDENNAALAETVQELTSQVEELISKEQAALTQRDEVREQRDEAREQLRELQDALDGNVRQIADLESHAEAMREEQQQLQTLAAEAAEQSGLANDQLQSDVAKLQEQLTEVRKEHDRLAEENSELGAAVSDAQQRADTLQNALDAKSSEPQIDPAEAAEWQAERAALIEKLADAELEVAELAQIRTQYEKQEGLERRFEIAVEDARKLKTRVAELEEQLTSGVGGAAPPVAAGAGTDLDWEAVKSRMMASLADDFDDADEQQIEEKLTIEGTIRITDDVVAEKEREIAELRTLLDSQTAAVGDVADGATAIAEIVDKDEIIQQEREQLAQLKDEWRKKLRQAEIEISVERAKMARQRAAIDDRQQTLDSCEVRHDANGASGSTETKPARGRWLARLGLKDVDE